MSDIGIRIVILGIAESRRALGTVNSDLSRLGVTIQGLTGVAAGLGTTLTNVGNTISGVGRSISIGITAPLALLGVGLLKAGIDFENTFAIIARVVEGAVDPMGNLTAVGEELRESFRELALEIPMASSAINELGGLVGQLGIHAEDIPAVTELIAQLGLTTEISAEEAAKGIIRLGNIMDVEFTDMEGFIRQAGSAILELGKSSVSTEGEILNLGLRLAAAGDRAKFSIPELLAWATTISDLGVRADSGGTAVSRAINEIILAVQTGSDNLKTFAQVTGESVDAFSRAFEEDASAALLNFIGKLEEGIAAGTVTKEMLIDMGLSATRTTDVLGRLGDAQDLFNKNLETANTGWEEQVALQEAFEIRAATVQNQLVILKNRFANLGITIFDLVKKDMEILIDAVGRILSFFTNLDEDIQIQIIRFAALAAAIGPVLLVVGLLISGIGTLVTIFAGLITPVGLAAVAIGALGLALASAFSPEINGLIALIGESIQTVWDIISRRPVMPDIVPDNIADRRDREGQPESTAAGIDVQIMEALPPEVANSIREVIKLFNEVKTTIETVISKIQEIAKTIRSVVDGDTSLRSLLPEEVITGFDLISAAAAKIAKALSTLHIPEIFTTGVAPNVIAFFEMVGKSAESNLPGILEGIATGIGRIAEGIGETLPNFIETLGPRLNEIFKNLAVQFKTLSPLGEAITKLFSALNDLFESITGTTIGETLGMVGKALGILAMISLETLILHIEQMTSSAAAASEMLVTFINKLTELVTWIDTKVIPAFESMKTSVTIAVAEIILQAQKLADDVIVALTRLKDDGLKFFGQLTEGIITYAQELYEKLIGGSIITDLVTDVIAAFVSLKDDVLKTFGDFVSGILGMAEEMAGKVGEFIGDLFGGGEVAAPVAPEGGADQFAGMKLSIEELKLAMLTLQETFTQTFLLYQTLFIIPVTESTLLMLSQLNLLWFNFNTLYVATLAMMTLAWQNLTLAMMGAWNTTISQSIVVFLGFRNLLIEIIHKIIQEFDILVEQILSGLGSINHNFNITGLHALELGDMILGAMSMVRNAIQGVDNAFANLGAAAMAAANDVANAVAIIMKAISDLYAIAFGSPELKIYYGFDHFGKLVGEQANPMTNDISAITGAMAALSSVSVPGGATTNTATTNNLSVNTNVSGVPIMDEDTLTDVIYDKFQKGQGRA